jgi:hypothetical protein
MALPPASAYSPTTQVPKTMRPKINMVTAIGACALGALVIASASGVDRSPQVRIAFGGRPAVYSTAHRTFRVTGRVKGLFPGAVKRVLVKITNSSRSRLILITARIGIGGDAARPDCVPRMYLRASRFKGRKLVAPHRTRRLRLTMSMLPSAPEACMGGVFPLRFRAKAVGR